MHFTWIKMVWTFWNAISLSWVIYAQIVLERRYPGLCEDIQIVPKVAPILLGSNITSTYDQRVLPSEIWLYSDSSQSTLEATNCIFRVNAHGICPIKCTTDDFIHVILMTGFSGQCLRSCYQHTCS